MCSKTPSQLLILKFCEKPWLVSTQNKPFGHCTKGEGKTKTNQMTIEPLKITGVPRTFPNDQTSLPITIKARQGTHHLITVLNITRPTHHDGCKTQPYQWISAVLGHPTMDEEEEAPLEGEGANTRSITINPLTASRIMPQQQGTRQTPAFNVGK